MPDAAPPPSLLDGAALFLDFDGTLVELADAPDSIEVPTRLPSLLRRLAARLDGRIGIVSGRSIASIERHLDCAGLAISGSHGAELRHADGTLVSIPAPDGLSAARQAVLTLFGREPGVMIEEKPAGLAVHFRHAPEAAARIEAFVGDLAARTGFVVQHGKMVAELRSPLADKGGALRTLMAEPNFLGARPLFVGDDLTDEHGFAAPPPKGGGGRVGGGPPARATAARWRLDDVAAVARWLEAEAA